MRCRMNSVEIFFPYSKSDNSYKYNHILNEDADYIFKHEDYIRLLTYKDDFEILNWQPCSFTITRYTVYVYRIYTHNKLDRGYCYVLLRLVIY